MENNITADLIVNWDHTQRRSQDFGLGGPVFQDLRRPARFGGGGVVAEIVRDRHKPARFSGGGGSSRNFSGSQ